MKITAVEVNLTYIMNSPNLTWYLDFTEDLDVEEDGEMDVEVDSSTDMVARLFRLSINSGVICSPATPTKVQLL